MRSCCGFEKNWPGSLTSMIWPASISTMAHHRGERLLGDDLGQDHVVVGVREFQFLGIELRHIGGEGIAAAGLVGLHRLIGGGEGDDFVFHA